jgi:hypothetical protein
MKSSPAIALPVPPRGQTVDALAVEPGRPGTVYAGTYSRIQQELVAEE